MNDDLIEAEAREQLVPLSEEQVRWLQAAVATLEEVAVAERRTWDGDPHPITWIVDPDATSMCAAELRAIVARWLSKDKDVLPPGKVNRVGTGKVQESETVNGSRQPTSKAAVGCPVCGYGHFQQVFSVIATDPVEMERKGGQLVWYEDPRGSGSDVHWEAAKHLRVECARCLHTISCEPAP